MINDLTREEQETLTDIFTYHAPTEEDIRNYQSLREAARYFAEVIMITCPKCADRTAAIRKVREALHVANASIALKGKSIS
jgi:hypothetical protein